MGLFNFLVKTKEADTHEFEIVHTLDTSDFQLGESVELEPFGLYIYEEKTRSSTRVVDITPTAVKLSDTKYRLNYKLHLLLPDYGYSAVNFKSTILRTWLLGSPTKISEKLYKATNGQYTNVYMQTGSFNAKQGEVVQIKLTNIFLHTYKHGILAAENSSQTIFLN